MRAADPVDDDIEGGIATKTKTAASDPGRLDEEDDEVELPAGEERRISFKRSASAGQTGSEENLKRPYVPSASIDGRIPISRGPSSLSSSSLSLAMSPTPGGALERDFVMSEADWTNRDTLRRWLRATGRAGSRTLSSEPGGAPLQMWVRLNVFDLCSIDTKRQSFTMNLYWEVAWKAPAGFDEHDMVMRAREAEFDPRVHFANLSSDMSQAVESWFEVIPLKYQDGAAVRKGLPEGTKLCCLRNKIRGATFRKQFHLRHFPFDVQAFDVGVRTDYAEDQVTLEVNEFVESYTRPGDFTTSNEFAFLDEIRYKSELKKEAVKRFGSIIFRITGYRRPGFVSNNIFLPIVLISGLGLVTFTIRPSGDDNEDFEKRFSINSSLLLTQVAYKFSTSANIPEIQYMTVADLVVLSSMLFQIVLIIWSTVLINFWGLEDRARVDRHAAYVCASVYITALTVLLTISMTKIFTCGHPSSEVARWARPIVWLVNRALPREPREPSLDKISSEGWKTIALRNRQAR